MLVHGLRLLVALITFAVGVGASRLAGSGGKAACGKYGVTYAPVHVGTLPHLPPPPPLGLSDNNRQPRTVYGGLLQTKTIDKLSPAYPHYGKVARVGGKVFVKVEVNEEGMVTKAKAVTGFGMLPEAAVKDALNTRFAPTRLSGQPVRVSGEILYDFVLD